MSLRFTMQPDASLVVNPWSFEQRWAPPKTPRKSGSDLIHSALEGRVDEAGGIVRVIGSSEAA
ncbi:hypothetical protein OLX02_19515, partial [Novosphingobium sp. KCTC 2891]|nr:hypothetical protein [Novosphingobium sp. KCTC 2891]